MRVLKYSPLAKIFLLALFSSQSVTGVIAASEKIISETFTNNSTADYLISNSGSGRNRENIAYSDDTGFGWGGYNAETAGSGASIAMRDNTNDIRIKDTTRNLNNANRSQTYLYTLFSANAAGGDLAPTELIDLSGANAEIIFETTTAAPDQQIRFLLRDRNNEWYLSDDTVSVSRNTTQRYNISTFSWKKIAETIATDMNELDGGGESLITTNSSSNPDFSEVSGGGFFIQQGFSVLTDELRVSSVAWRGSDITTTPSAVNITLEAEDYTAFNDANPGVDSFSLNTRADASGGSYMQSVGQWGESYLEYEFEVPVEDVYQIAVRGTGVSGGTNSFRVSVDGGADSVVQLNKDDSWGWATIEDANSGLGPYSLSAGQHVLRLKKRERNAKIDQLRITSSTATPLPGASLSPSSLNFAEEDVGSVSNPQSVTLSNTGAAPLNITSITTTGDFSESNDCNNLVAAGSSCQIDVSFSPASAGSLTGALVVDGDAQKAPYNVSLKGNSVVTVTPPSGAEFYQDFDAVATDSSLSEGQLREMFSTDRVRISSRTAIVSDPANSGRGNVLRMFFPKATFGNEAGGQWVTKLPSTDEYYFAYDIYVPSGFNFPLSSKMPGLFGGSMGVASGNNATLNGIDGFSVFQGFTSERKAGDTTGWPNVGDGNIGASTFTYNNPQRKRRYNPALNDSWNGNPARLAPGRWVRLEQHVKLNSANSTAGSGVKANGVYEAWLDGVKVYSENNWIYRQTSNLKIDGIFFIWWYGGSGDAFNSRENQYVYYDNFMVSTQPITH